MTNDLEIMWWGYLHQNNTAQLKRWFGDNADWTTDCEGNDFVLRVVPPFSAPTQSAAWVILKNRLGLKPYGEAV